MAPAHRTDLQSFAAALAERLPGTWTTNYAQHTSDTDQFDRSWYIWDFQGLVERVDITCVLGHDAILTGPDATRLYVIERPRYPQQFLVAALMPTGIPQEYLAVVESPRGIAVPSDPARAANQIARRLLPRYGESVEWARCIQASPPFRPLVPPAVSVHVSMLWHRNGLLTASAPDQHAAAALYLAGFQYNYSEKAFFLDGSDCEHQARCINEASRQLAARSITVSVRNAPAPAPSTAPPKPSTAPAHTAKRRR
ncbi:hypothetical protein [Streptomyces decoyicus]|uniref:hypothetical protein n=1 Tax=Streptomyces decoyicus TaxID=249567 RepID=UPI0038663789